MKKLITICLILTLLLGNLSLLASCEGVFAPIEGYAPGVNSDDNIHHSPNNPGESMNESEHEYEDFGTEEYTKNDPFEAETETSEADNLFPGKGTSESPYEISSKEQLILLATWINDNTKPYLTERHFILTRDLNLDGMEWTPIGNLTDFRGVFDGNGYSICNFHITEHDHNAQNVGLFGNLNGGTIQNLTVGQCEIKIATTSVIRAGIIVGQANGWLTNCHVYDATVLLEAPDATYAGGIAGRIFGGAVADCTVDVRLEAQTQEDKGWYPSGTYAGGITGDLNNAEARNCRATVNIAAYSFGNNAWGGGLFGNAEYATIYQCHATGSVYVEGQTDYVENGNYDSLYGGGLAGYSYEAPIDQCSFDGTVAVKGFSIGAYSAGLVAHCTSLIQNCYATGEVTLTLDGGTKSYFNAAGGYAGGLIGIADVATIVNSFAAVDLNVTSNADNGIYVGGLAGGIISNTNCSLSLENCFTLGDISVVVETAASAPSQNPSNPSEGIPEMGWIDVSVGKLAGLYNINTVLNCYVFTEQSVTARKDNEELTLRELPEGVKESRLKVLDTEDFYISTLGWSTDIWDLSNLHQQKNLFPTLKKTY